MNRFEVLQHTILEETARAKEELAEKLADPMIKSVGCIDKKASFKGDWNPPGGVSSLTI